MAETLKVGDIFPVKSWKELDEAGLKYWEQVIIISGLGEFFMDPEEQFRDGKDRWDSRDGTTRITTKVGTHKITEIRRHKTR